MKNKIIMMCAPAKSGKDTLYPILKKQMEDEYGGTWERFAFADELKRQCEGYILEKFGVSVWDDSKKHIFRQYLIDYGERRRSETDGMFLIDHFTNHISNNPDVNFIVTDYRFVEEYGSVLRWLWMNSYTTKYELHPIYIQRYIQHNEHKFVLEPTIPQEIDSYPEIRKGAKLNQIEYILGPCWEEELMATTKFNI